MKQKPADFQPKEHAKLCKLGASVAAMQQIDTGTVKVREQLHPPCT
ncbi:hypothetical protein MIZ03_3920 [Rhodoferax lithotrophicus]|uniref:Uncharacterized protein n=1 Tax=Rhodoferax lithotrophicus TaxID=2798804 RepID=A0ABM7MRP2_9BURK|nr:hypothetical protein MIZ03_3920 [Rhodoferax sp. MIZ03]